VTATNFRAAPDPVRLIVSCSHCGSELPLNEITRALLGALHAAPIPDGLAPPPRPSGDRTAALPPRQREVAVLLGRGWRAPEIAARLGISVNTVRKHKKALYVRLGVHSQAELLDGSEPTCVPSVARVRALRAAPVPVDGCTRAEREAVGG
jgi:DNA-binding NarL/FixJ family response regulator